MIPGTCGFTVGTPPTIPTYSPSHGLPGTTVTINGTGFGSVQGANFVAVDSAVTGLWATWNPISWSDTRIVVTIPNNAPMGKVYLYVTANAPESGGKYPFTVGTPPTIDCYSQGSGVPGTSITISGSGFGTAQTSTNFVSVRSAVTGTWTTWPATGWSDSEMVVPVPSNMPLGKVYIYTTANALQSGGTFPFTVGIPPTISDYSPGWGSPGDAYRC